MAIFPVQIEKIVIIVFIVRIYKKSYQRENKFLEFSQDTKREELKIRKSDVTLQWLHDNSCIVMASLRRLHCIGFVQWLSYLLLAYVYKQSYHLAGRQTKLENIGPPSRTYTPMKMHHYLYFKAVKML